MNMPLVLLNRRRRGTGFNPASLFGLNEQGVWYDPSDVANLAWRRNLLTWTEQFDNAAWTKAQATVTANGAVAPDGTMTADKLIASTANDTHYVNRTVSLVGAHTLSAFFKASGYNRVLFGDGSGTAKTLAVDLQTGAIVSTGSSVSNGSVQAVGNGWFRVSFTITDVLGFTPFIDNGSVVFAGDGTSGILIWGAQLELGSTATDYQRITDVNTEVIERFPAATLYKDITGNQPVTTPGDAVALMLDKSKGLVQGSELVVNGDFATDTGWNKGTGVTISGGKINYTGFTTSTTPTTAITIKANTTYRVIVSGVTYISGAITLTVGGASVNASIGSNVLVQTTTTASLSLSSAAFEGSIDNISVRELPGNHAVQGTAASQPIYGVVPQGGRRNVFLQTEQWNLSPWVPGDASVVVNSTTAPNGTVTADKLVETATTALHFISQTTTISAGLTTFSTYLKAAERQFAFLYHGLTNTGFSVNLLTGATGLPASSVAPVASSVTLVGDGWYRVSMTVNATAGSQFFRVYLSDTLNGGGSYTGNGTSGIFAWGAQVEAGSLTPYQRVSTLYDVTEAGVPSCSYLFFDGGSDSMATGNIDFTATDKMTVFAGVRKNSDAASMLLEMSVSSSSNARSFYIYNDSNTRIESSLNNGSGIFAYQSSSVAAPTSRVLTTAYDIAGATRDTEITQLRLNGAQDRAVLAGGAFVDGTGNFGNYPLYLGFRSSGATLYFNGNLFGLVVRGAASTTAQITATEAWLAPKTGVTL
jgi:hypothetical protein